MSIYDSLLANQQQGLQTQNQDQMTLAQMPTFADKFLAGLRSGQQMGMQQQMHGAQMQHMGAMNQNYKDQRINQEMAAAGKYATPENAAQFSQRIQDLGGPQIDFSAGGSESQKRDIQTRIAAQKNEIASQLAGLKKALNEAQVKKLDAQVPLIQAQIDNLQSKSDFLDNKNDVLFSGDNPMYGSLIQSQINRNNQPPTGANPSGAPVINATAKLNAQALDRATKQINWVARTTGEKMQILKNGGASDADALKGAASVMPPVGNPAYDNVVQQGVNHYRSVLSAAPPDGTVLDTTPGQ